MKAATPSSYGAAQKGAAQRRTPSGLQQEHEGYAPKSTDDTLSSDSEFACFLACQILAWRATQQAPHQGLLPSGARIFYYTVLALQRQGLLDGSELSRGVLPRKLSDDFLMTALTIGSGLRDYYPVAVRLRRNPLFEGPWLLTTKESAKDALALGGAPLRQEVPCEHSVLPSTSTELHLAGLMSQFFALRLPISPVARPEDALPVAFRLLKAQLIQEAARVGQVLPDEMYLYEEPLSAWLVRLLQGHPWVKEILLGLHK